MKAEYNSAWRTDLEVRVPFLAIANRKSRIENQKARVAELADAPDLGYRNHRFQNRAFRFKKQSIYERKKRLSGKDTHAREASRNSVILAQTLAQRLTRFGIIRVGIAVLLADATKFCTSEYFNRPRIMSLN